MANKILSFLGLAESDERESVIDSKRRRANYMDRIQRLVLPENEEAEDGDEAASQNAIQEGQTANQDADNPQAARRASKSYTVDREAPLPDAIPDPEPLYTRGTPQPEEDAADNEPEPEEDEPYEADDEPAKQPARSFGRHAAPTTSFSDKVKGFGKSLRRPNKDKPILVLIRCGAREMLEDITQALTEGQIILLDFEREDRATAQDVIKRVINFVRVHNGAYYAVTSSSLLLSLNPNVIVEWRTEDDGAED